MPADAEMESMRGNEDLEKSSLILSKEKSAALVRAAYRAELATKRAVLLALLIVPILLIIVLWHLFDSNARLGTRADNQPSGQNVAHP